MYVYTQRKETKQFQFLNGMLCCSVEFYGPLRYKFLIQASQTVRICMKKAKKFNCCSINLHPVRTFRWFSLQFSIAYVHVRNTIITYNSFKARYRYQLSNVLKYMPLLSVICTLIFNSVLSLATYVLFVICSSNKINLFITR